jgi:hypothetical protein
VGVPAVISRFPLGITVGGVLVQQDRAQLAEKGLDVLDPILVKIATKERVPTSLQMAAKIMEETHLDAAATCKSTCGAGSRR